MLCMKKLIWISSWIPFETKTVMFMLSIKKAANDKNIALLFVYRDWLLHQTLTQQKEKSNKFQVLFSVVFISWSSISLLIWY